MDKCVEDWSLVDHARFLLRRLPALCLLAAGFSAAAIAGGYFLGRMAPLVRTEATMRVGEFNRTLVREPASIIVRGRSQSFLSAVTPDPEADFKLLVSHPARTPLVVVRVVADSEALAAAVLKNVTQRLIKDQKERLELLSASAVAGLASARAQVQAHQKATAGLTGVEHVMRLADLEGRVFSLEGRVATIVEPSVFDDPDVVVVERQVRWIRNSILAGTFFALLLVYARLLLASRPRPVRRPSSVAAAGGEASG